MRARAIPVLLLLLLAPAVADAGPLERVDRLLEESKWDDAAQVARKWLDRHTEDADADAMAQRLAEAEYQRVLAAPSVARTSAWRSEFGEAARRADLDSLEANLRLYAVPEGAGEEAYRTLAEEWPGTAAGREALSRAEALAFEAARSDGSAASLSSFLGRYDGMTHGEEALALWRDAAWSEAEAADDATAWRELRMQDPEHPRALEALDREASRALSEAGPEASAAELVKMARRYAEVDAGWEALQRATDHALVRALGADGAPLLEEPLGPGLGPAAKPIVLPGASRIEVVHDGRLPRNAVLEVELTVTVDDRALSWERATFRQSARWGVRADPPTAADAANAFQTPTPLCSGDLLQDGALVVALRLGENTATWSRPATFSAPCAGPLPVAAQRSDGLLTRLRIGDAHHRPPTDLLGLEWVCDGPTLATEHGVAAVCGGWSMEPVGTGWLVRPPVATAAHEDGASPWLDSLEGAGWHAVDVPDAWHYAGRPGCPLGEAPSGAAGPPPWVPADASFEPRDVDGDGTPDWLGAFGAAGDGWLVLVGSTVPADGAWAHRWPTDIDPATAVLRREGCAFRWTSAP